MKKQLTVWILSLVCMPLAAYAEADRPTQENSESMLETVGTNLRRAVSDWFGDSKVEWAKRVAEEDQRANTAAGAFQTSFYAISTTSYPQHPICGNGLSKERCAQVTKLFNERKSFFQTLLKRNEALAKYTFFVSVPSDLYNLNNAEMSLLGGFLSQSVVSSKFDKYYTPARLKKPEAGVTEIMLVKKDMNPLFLRVDGKKRIVYFFYKKY